MRQLYAHIKTPRNAGGLRVAARSHACLQHRPSGTAKFCSSPLRLQPCTSPCHRRAPPQRRRCTPLHVACAGGDRGTGDRAAASLPPPLQRPGPGEAGGASLWVDQEGGEEEAVEALSGFADDLAWGQLGEEEGEAEEGDEEDGWLLEGDEDALGGEGELPGTGPRPYGDDLASPDEALEGISTGGAAFGAAALAAAQTVLSRPQMQGLELYALRAADGRVDVRLDRLDDVYGSPSIEDIEGFSRMLLTQLEAALGAEEAGAIGLEVSSPGAERQLRLPQDLERFGQLPLFVEWVDDTGATQAKVLELEQLDAAGQLSVWRVADVRANAPVKGRKLSKRQREARINIPLAALAAARIHVDF